ncbi:MAG TPA: Tex-like N-terminal domain-containing protein [Planctomycetota bacterium]|nr:Tex-like N-terminal domain-containing protein [Planctomycetota bacterium]
MKRTADLLKLEPKQVETVAALFKEGASIPFIARYRRDRTGELDEARLTQLKDKLDEFNDDETRRETALKAIRDTGKLTPELEEKIKNAATREELEDLYMAFRSRRRTRSNAAKHKGLEPLAELISKQESSTTTPDEIVKPFISEEKAVKDAQEAFSGARDIVAENIAEDPACRKIARALLKHEGKLVTKPREGIDLSKGKYASFANFADPIGKVPGHRLLAAMRGASEKQLYLSLDAPKDKVLEQLKAKLITNADAPLKAELSLAIEECYERLLGPSLDNDLRLELKREAETEAIEVFAKNLRAILLHAPLGAKAVLALGPAVKAPWKIALIGADGKVISHAVLHPNKDDEEKKKAADEVVKLVKEHGVAAVAIVSGPGSKDADILVRDAFKAAEIKDVPRVPVHEGAAAAYAGTAHAREEIPDADNALRTTVSAGRRLQDPLTEILKLDLKTIPLGQFQHDVDQGALQRKLEETARSVVAQVGANVNAASEAVLRHVPGLNAELAKAIVAARKEKGAFKTRDELKNVAGVDAKVYEQCIGFLRIPDSENPLDKTSIHPEQYAVVEAMAASVSSTVKELAGNAEAVGKIDRAKFVSATLSDADAKEILAELSAPGRDPRGTFVPPQFNDEVQDMADLKEGMVLNGVVTNLAQFGAFVDVGVHQDGLVHISAITHKFIRDPSEVLTVGQQVKVKVLSIEPEKKRISLSIKALEEQPRRPARGPRGPRSQEPRPSGESRQPGEPRPSGEPRPQGSGPESAPAAGSAQTQERRPRRFDRPRGPRAGGPPRGASRPNEPRPNEPRPQGSGQPAEGAAAGAETSTAAAPVSGGISSGGAPADRPRDGGDRRGRFGGGERRGGPGGPRGDRPPAHKPEPGKPDYSKFFVKGKRKDKEKRSERPDAHAASRDEVREVMRHQSTGGISMADLLKQAGVKEE